jgi:sulfonate transport system permease protein
MNLLKNLKIKDKIIGLIIPLAALIAWEYVTRHEYFSPQLLISPKTVLTGFYDLWENEDLFMHVKISLLRVSLGFLAGSSAGFLFGILLGLSRIFEDFIGPLFHSVRQIPLLGWMPLLMLWFGVDEGFKIIFIAIGAFYPVVLNTYEGIRSTRKEYIEVGEVFEYSRFKLFMKVILPASIPSIFTGIKISISVSWMLVVGAEFVAASEGIGYLMTWGRQLFQLDIVMVGVFLIGIIAVVINWFVGLLEKYLLRWRKTFNAE